MVPAHPLKKSGILNRGFKVHTKKFSDVSHEDYLLILRKRFPALESHNGNHMDASDKVTVICRDYSFDTIGGSDSHKVGEFGTCYTLFHKPINSDEELLEELRHGRFFAESYSLVRQAL